MIHEIQSIVQGYLNAVGLPTVIHGTVTKRAGEEVTVRVDESTTIPPDAIEMPAHLSAAVKAGAVVALLQFDRHQRYYILGVVS